METTRRVRLCTLLALSSLLLEQPRTRAEVGNGSCETGIGPCFSNSGTIGTNSCNGDFACQDNSGQIGDGACNGERACFGNPVDIGPDQCNGDPDPNTGRGVCEPSSEHQGARSERDVAPPRVLGVSAAVLSFSPCLTPPATGSHSVRPGREPAVLPLAFP